MLQNGEQRIQIETSLDGQIVTSQLMIFDVQPTDAGNYAVTASNNSSSVRMTASLVVDGQFIKFFNEILMAYLWFNQSNRCQCHAFCLRRNFLLASVLLVTICIFGLR